MQRKELTWLVGIIGLYFLTRLPQLTFLPVFSDEAIYIRWAQMMTSDPKQFWFLPLYDGKPPLFMWLLVPLLPLYQTDPVLVGRLLSVVIGGLGLLIMPMIIKELGGSIRAGRLAQLLTIILPLNFFLNRLALMDGLLTLWLLITSLGLIKLSQKFSLKRFVITGLAYALALGTKTPALFLLGIYFLFGLINLKKIALRKYFLSILPGIGALGLGLAIFSLMKFSPLFPFLFNRSQDFTFSLNEIVSGEWRFVLASLGKYLTWIFVYMTPMSLGFLGFTFIDWIKNKSQDRQKEGLLWLMGLGFILPYVLFGRVVSSRYFLPMMIFWVPAMALILDRIWLRSKKLALALLGGVVIYGLWFMWPWYTDLNQTHLTYDDKKQYLADWSAGFGILEVRDYLKNEAQTKKVVVGTEGFFGTLPDGLFIYFDKSIYLNNLTIFGIGQPVLGLPDELKDKRQEAEVYLFVNEHRLNFDYEACCQLIAAYSRPEAGPKAMLLKLK